MLRFAFLLLLSAGLQAAAAAVDFDDAAQVYQAADVRTQMRASLLEMPDKMRRMFFGDSASQLSDEQLEAVVAAARQAFRLDVFEPSAIAALAANLDPPAVKKSLQFLQGDLGRRMVAADVAIAMVDPATNDKIMSGEIAAPATPQREALLAKLEEAAHSTDDAVQIYVQIVRSIAVGTAIGQGGDRIAADERARRALDDAARARLVPEMRQPLLRYIAYGYRDLSDADLKALTAFLDSKAGKVYVRAYAASMNAGFEAMGRRCGERIGEAWRELARAQLSRPAEAHVPEAPAP